MNNSHTPLQPKILNQLISQQSQSVICGILLDITYFLRDKATDKDLFQYVHSITTYVQLLQQIHDESIFFIIPYTTTTKFIEQHQNTQLLHTLYNTITSLIHQNYETTTPKLSTALSIGLCAINKYADTHKNIPKKMVVISTPFDASPSYIPLMNCAFASQKIGVVVDTLVLSPEPSKCVFCQQLSHLTHGVYTEVTLNSLMPRLLANNSIDSCMNEVIRPVGGINQEIDWRLWCFRTGKLIDKGYVCSSCFAVFSEKQEKCPICEAEYIKE
ncbi:General transcription factor IIH subunit 3 [Entamoeba marina]